MNAYTPSSRQLIEAFTESVDYLRLAEMENKQAEMNIFSNRDYLYCWHETSGMFSIWNAELGCKAKETIRLKLSFDKFKVVQLGEYTKVDLYLIKRDCAIDIEIVETIKE